MQPEQSLFQDIYLVSEFFASAQQSLELLHFLIDHPGLIGLRVHVFLEVAWCQWRVILKLFPHEKVVVSIDPRPDLQNCLLEPLSILVIAAFAQKLQSCTKQPLMSSLCFSHQLGHLFSETNIFQSLGTAAFFPTCGPCASPLHFFNAILLWSKWPSHGLESLCQSVVLVIRNFHLTSWQLLGAQIRFLCSSLGLSESTIWHSIQIIFLNAAISNSASEGHLIALKNLPEHDSPGAATALFFPVFLAVGFPCIFKHRLVWLHLVLAFVIFDEQAIDQLSLLCTRILSFFGLHFNEIQNMLRDGTTVT